MGGRGAALGGPYHGAGPLGELCPVAVQVTAFMPVLNM